MTELSVAQLVALLVSSSVLAALVSIGGNHLLAQFQFKRDYFKEIIAKRLNAYQQVDQVIGILGATTYDDSGRIAHAVFLNKALYDSATMIAATGVELGLYLSEAVRNTLSELNLILLKLPADISESQAFEIGVTHRETLSALRRRLESLVAADLVRLYRVRPFLKEKQRLAARPELPRMALLPKHGAFSFKQPHEDGIVTNEIPLGIPIAGKPGLVISPHVADSRPVDVRGFPSGSQVRCPYTGRLFLVP